MATRLAACFHFTSRGFVDLASGEKMTASGSPSVVVAAGSEMVRLVKETPNYFTANVLNWSGASCCVEWYGKITALDVSGSIIVMYGSTFWQFVGSDAIYIASEAISTSGYDVGGGYHHCVIGGVVDNANQRFWFDGIDISTSNVAKVSLATGTKTVYVGTSSGSPGGNWDLSADLAYVRFWNGLSTANVRDLKADPYQFLIPA